MQRNGEARSRNNCCRVKAVSIMYSECVSVALVSQQTKRMRLIILSFMACLYLPYFYTLSHKRHDLLKKVITGEVHALFFSTSLFETFFIIRKTERDVIINIYWSSCEAPVIIVRF